MGDGRRRRRRGRASAQSRERRTIRRHVDYSPLLSTPITRRGRGGDTSGTGRYLTERTMRDGGAGTREGRRWQL